MESNVALNMPRVKWRRTQRLPIAIDCFDQSLSSTVRPIEAISRPGPGPTSRNESKEQSKRMVTTARLSEMKARGQKIAMLTAYDDSFARILDQAGL